MNEQMEAVLAFITSTLGFLMVVGMTVHVVNFYCQSYNSKPMSKLVFFPAIISLLLSAVYLLDQSVLIIIDKFDFVSVNNDFSSIFWMSNGIIHKFAKESMYLFFFARLDQIFHGTIYHVPRKTLIFLASISVLLFLTIAILAVLQTNDIKIFDHLSFLILNTITLICEIMICVIVLKLLISRFVRLYINQKMSESQLKLQTQAFRRIALSRAISDSMNHLQFDMKMNDEWSAQSGQSLPPQPPRSHKLSLSQSQRPSLELMPNKSNYQKGINTSNNCILLKSKSCSLIPKAKANKQESMTNKEIDHENHNGNHNTLLMLNDEITNKSIENSVCHGNDGNNENNENNNGTAGIAYATEMNSYQTKRFGFEESDLDEETETCDNDLGVGGMKMTRKNTLSNTMSTNVSPMKSGNHFHYKMALRRTHSANVSPRTRNNSINLNNNSNFQSPQTMAKDGRPTLTAIDSKGHDTPQVAMNETMNEAINEAVNERRDRNLSFSESRNAFNFSNLLNGLNGLNVGARKSKSLSRSRQASVSAFSLDSKFCEFSQTFLNNSNMNLQKYNHNNNGGYNNNNSIDSVNNLSTVSGIFEFEKEERRLERTKTEIEFINTIFEKRREMLMKQQAMIDEKNNKNGNNNNNENNNDNNNEEKKQLRLQKFALSQSLPHSGNNSILGSYNHSRNISPKSSNVAKLGNFESGQSETKKVRFSEDLDLTKMHRSGSKMVIHLSDNHRKKEKTYLDIAMQSTNLVTLSMISSMIVFISFLYSFSIFYLIIDSVCMSLTIYLSFSFSKKSYSIICFCHKCIDYIYITWLFDICCIGQCPLYCRRKCVCCFKNENDSQNDGKYNKRRKKSNENAKAKALPSVSSMGRPPVKNSKEIVIIDHNNEDNEDNDDNEHGNERGNDDKLTRKSGFLCCADCDICGFCQESQDITKDIGTIDFSDIDDTGTQSNFYHNPSTDGNTNINTNTSTTTVSRNDMNQESDCQTNSDMQVVVVNNGPNGANGANRANGDQHDEIKKRLSEMINNGESNDDDKNENDKKEKGNNFEYDIRAVQRKSQSSSHHRHQNGRQAQARVSVNINTSVHVDNEQAAQGAQGGRKITVSTPVRVMNHIDNRIHNHMHNHLYNVIKSGNIDEENENDNDDNDAKDAKDEKVDINNGDDDEDDDDDETDGIGELDLGPNDDKQLYMRRISESKEFTPGAVLYYGNSMDSALSSNEMPNELTNELDQACIKLGFSSVCTNTMTNSNTNTNTSSSNSSGLSNNYSLTSMASDNIVNVENVISEKKYKVGQESINCSDTKSQLRMTLSHATSSYSVNSSNNSENENDNEEDTDNMEITFRLSSVDVSENASSEG